MTAPIDMMGLTLREADYLTMLHEYVHAHGVTPTYEEMCERMGIKSRSTVTHHIQALERKGFLTRGKKNGARSIILTTPDRGFKAGDVAVRIAECDLETVAEILRRTITDDDFVMFPDEERSVCAAIDRLDEAMA